MESKHINQSDGSDWLKELIKSDRLDSDKDVIDLNRLFLKFIHRWYYFVLALCLTFSGAYLYNRFTVSTYEVTASLLFDINGNKNNAGTIDPGNVLKGFGLNPGMQNIDNQINILSSYTLVKKCLNMLPFDIEYYMRGKVNKLNLYPTRPFIVVIDTLELIPYNVEFTVRLMGDGDFHIAIEQNDHYLFNEKARFGEILEIGSFKFHIEESMDFWHHDWGGVNYFYFSFRNPEELVRNYQKRLEIGKISKEGTIVLVSLEGVNYLEDRDFLSTLINELLESNLNKKNYEADRTIRFIDDQLKGISDSLLIAENKLQEFRSKNRVMNISDQGSQVLAQAVKLEDEKSVLLIQADYYKYLSEYLSEDITKNKITAPSTIGISDPSLVRLVEQLSQLQTEYLSLGGGARNPMTTNLILRIDNTKEALVEVLNGIIRNNNYAIDENRSRLRELNQRAEALPETERKLLGIERGFKLNDALFTFLMEKRAEAQIRKASNSSDTEIIDPPRVLPVPVKPNTLLSYVIALFLSMAIPAIIIFIQYDFNDKVDSDIDLKNITGQPISGHILHMKKANTRVVFTDSDSDVAESFRSLRTRLQFFTKNKKSPIILVTSSMAGEGKSFVAINIASAYSLDKKKTVLVDLDLRRATLHKNFEVTNDKGVSTFIIGKDPIEEIIQQSEYPNLDLILSGPIPPNPAELINSERLDELIEHLKKQYDYIVIDSTPVGTVSDSFELATKVDTCIFVVRYGKTPKPILISTLEDINSYGIKNIGVVVNDLRRKNNSSYSYRYKYT